MVYTIHWIQWPAVANALIDRDFDGVNDVISLDSDGDGIFDLVEALGVDMAAQVDSNQDGMVDASDANGLQGLGGGALLVTGQADLEKESQDDYLASLQITTAVQLPSASNLQVERDSSDFDRDGYPDVTEIEFGGNPLDGAETDSDGDGIPDWVENTDVDANGSTDNDNDGVPDLLEQLIGSDMDVSESSAQLFDMIDQYLLDSQRYEGRSPQPVIWVEQQQNAQAVLNFSRNGGLATLELNIGNFHVYGDQRDNNSTPVYQWSANNNLISAVSNNTLNEATLEFNPAQLSAGVYHVTANVDLFGHRSSVDHVIVVSTQAAVVDSDQDGQADISDIGNDLFSANLGYLHHLQRC